MKVYINPHGVSLQQLIIATCSTMSTYHQLTLLQCRECASAPSKRPRVDTETDSDSVGAGTASPDSSQLDLQAGFHNQVSGSQMPEPEVHNIDTASTTSNYETCVPVAAQLQVPLSPGSPIVLGL